MRILYDYALQHVGLPYRWGGDDPIKGYDCSGFVLELLKSAGEFSEHFDTTAQGLFNYFSENGKGKLNTWGLGALAFYGKSASKVSHVAFCLDEYRMVEAGGGGSRTRDAEDAARQNAYIRVRLIRRRSDMVGMIKPYYRKIGMI